jgi:hypothetical protein
VTRSSDDSDAMSIALPKALWEAAIKLYGPPLAPTVVVEEEDGGEDIEDDEDEEAGEGLQPDAEEVEDDDDYTPEEWAAINKLMFEGDEDSDDGEDDDEDDDEVEDNTTYDEPTVDTAASLASMVSFVHQLFQRRKP